MKRFLLSVLASLVCLHVAADKADDRYMTYINTYSAMAVDQQEEFGIL